MIRKSLHTDFSRLGLLVGIMIFCLSAFPASAGQTIYDSGVEQRLPLSSKQRSKVRKIVRNSDRKMNQVFRKFGIDPRARPDFDKLVQASSELQAIERHERNQMIKILNDKQLTQYDRLIDQTRIRVRKAAQ